MTTLNQPNLIPQPENLAALSHLPRDEGGPVFAEPWQAQAFALAVRLSAQGHFTWKEWAAALADELKAAASRGEPDDGSRYSRAPRPLQRLERSRLAPRSQGSLGRCLPAHPARQARRANGQLRGSSATVNGRADIELSDTTQACTFDGESRSSWNHYWPRASNREEERAQTRIPITMTNNVSPRGSANLSRFMLANSAPPRPNEKITTRTPKRREAALAFA